MKPIFIAAFCSVVALVSCDSSNPFDVEDTDTDGGDTDDGGDSPGDNDDGDEDTSFTVSGKPPPGVSGPVADATSSVVRFEERNDEGGGYAENFTYDAATDSFTVDTLAFDGEGAYRRDNEVGTLGPNGSFAVYEAAISTDDFLDGDPINQIVPYRAIVGVSKNTVDGTPNSQPRTSFAIVRTGGYIKYGFGGFVYQRNGEVILPTTGQATFAGDYAGEVISNGAPGMYYTQGDMTMEFDFDDPTNATAAVKGYVTNREAFNLDGSTVDFDNNGPVGNVADLPLPTIHFVLDGVNGNMSPDGDISGGVFTTYTDASGSEVDYESGTYYGIVAGDTTQPDGGEVVGVMVLTATDPRPDANGATIQETGGFIVYRTP